MDIGVNHLDLKQTTLSQDKILLLQRHLSVWEATAETLVANDVIKMEASLSSRANFNTSFYLIWSRVVFIYYLALKITIVCEKGGFNVTEFSLEMNVLTLNKREFISCPSLKANFWGERGSSTWKQGE